MKKGSTGKETSDATIFPRNFPPANRLLKPLAIDRIIELVRTDRKPKDPSGLHKAFAEKKNTTTATAAEGFRSKHARF
jgi:hypothetical protein